MTNKYYSKKVYTELVECGFTIIELLIVMAIIGVLMPLGINAFVNTRRSREVSEAAANARDAIKNARAMALSVSSNPSSSDWPVAYEVVLSGNNITTRIKSVTDGKQHSGWDANVLYVDNEISNLTLDSVGISSLGCDRVIFSSVSGQMYVYNGNYFTPVLGDCYIKFGLESKERFLKLNSQEKVFEIVGNIPFVEEGAVPIVPGGGGDSIDPVVPPEEVM